MNLLELKAKIRKHPVKAVIFRKGLPPIVDYAGRVDNERYHLLGQNKVIPSPPSNEHIFFFDKHFWIFLKSPRIGTYNYMREPDIVYDPEEQVMKVNYLTRVRGIDGKLLENQFTKEELKVLMADNKVKNSNETKRYNELEQLANNDEETINQLKQKIMQLGRSLRSKQIDKQQYNELNDNYQKQMNELKNKVIDYKKEMDKILNTVDKDFKVIETSFEMFDHDDLNFLAEETQRSESKYTEKASWWEKHGQTVMNMAFVVGVAIALWIIWDKIILQASREVPRGALTVICNYTQGSQGVVL